MVYIHNIQCWKEQLQWRVRVCRSFVLCFVFDFPLVGPPHSDVLRAVVRFVDANKKVSKLVQHISQRYEDELGVLRVCLNLKKKIIIIILNWLFCGKNDHHYQSLAWFWPSWKNPHGCFQRIYLKLYSSNW